MLRILAALTAIATSCTLEAYDIEQLIRDTRKNPDKIYRNLHPAAKSFVDRGIELYQTNPAYREEKYVEFETDPAKMKPARIWSFIWADNGYPKFYDNGYTVIHSHDQGEWRYVTVKEEGYSEEVLMIDTYVFRKHGDTYLFYPPAGSWSTTAPSTISNPATTP